MQIGAGDGGAHVARFATYGDTGYLSRASSARIPSSTSRLAKRLDEGHRRRLGHR
ncbi:MAG: hypothetical protein R3E53_18590 [Myxococcota bacterium]